MSTLDIFFLEEGHSLSCIFTLDHFFLIILFYLQVEFYKFRKHLFPSRVDSKTIGGST